MNKVMLIGNLGADPDVRSLNNGSKIVNLNLGTHESWKDKQTGEKRKKTEWHRIVIFNENLARVAEQYLRKGSQVYIEGQLQTRKWQDQSGNDRYSTEVVLQNYRGELKMLDGPATERAPSHDTQMPKYNYQKPEYGSASSNVNNRDAHLDEMDDEIPF